MSGVPALRATAVLLAAVGLVGAALTGATSAHAATQLQAPTGVQATPQGGSAAVGWDWPVTVPSGYPYDSGAITHTVTADPGGATCTAPPNGSYCLVPGLTNGVAYRFTVVATDADGDSPASAPTAPVVPVDTLAPFAGHAVFTPDRVPVTGGDVQVAVPIGDDSTGVDPSTVVAWFRGPSSATTAHQALTLRSGSAQNGIWSGTLHIPPSGGGTWWLQLADIGDLAGNTRTVDSGGSVVEGIPTAPGTPSVELLPGRVVRVSWTPPLDDGGLPITGYEIDGEGAYTTVGGSTTSLRFDFGDRSPGLRPTYTVSAINSGGWRGPSATSTPVAVPATEPGVPGTLSTPGPNGTAVHLNWGTAFGHASPVTGYVVTADPGGEVCRTVAATACDAYGLEPGVAHALTVRAINAIGTGPATAPLSVTPQSVPNAPVDVRIEGHGTSARLSWTPGGASGLPTCYAVDSIPATGKETCGTSVTLRGLVPGDTSIYRVVARNALGSSAPSATVGFTASARPDRPARPSITRAAEALRVRWRAPEANGAPISAYVVRVVQSGASARTFRVSGSMRAITVAQRRGHGSATVTIQAVNREGTSSASSAGSIRW